jgi:pimeloyl-ACP methyl ester carboxylesterase
MVALGRLNRFGKQYRAGFASAIVATALLWCSPTRASEPKVLLFRGWFGVFSTGLDTIAKELKAKGIDAQVAGHLGSSRAAAEIVKLRAAGTVGPIVLVGHSQGANNVIEMARTLEASNVPVDLLVTLAPFMQDPVPANVLHAINFYQAPGWGAPLEGAPGFHGKLTNNDMADDPTVFHITIDKSSKVQAEIVREVVALQTKEVAGALPRASARAR